MVTLLKGLAVLWVQTLAILSPFLCFELMLQNVETSLVAGFFMLICQN